MVTNYPQQLTASRARALGEEQNDTSWIGRVVDAIRQAFCGMRGHDSVLHFQEKRVMLRCTSCGYDSPGWEIDSRRPRVTFHGDAQRHLLRPESIRLRRTA
jgi:hypothetical protein